MQLADVAFYAPDPNSEIDQLIILAQNAAGLVGRYVHCELAISQRYLVGAVEPVVRVGPLGKLQPAQIITPPWADAAAAERAADYAVSQIGTVYNAPGTVLTGLGLLCPAWKHVVMTGGDVFGRHMQYCSQLVTNALLAGGLVPPDAAALSSPAALAAWLGVNST